MIRRVILSAAGGVALASSVFAADVYSPGAVSYGAAPVMVPVSTWAGFYLGANGGWGGFHDLGFRDDTFLAAVGPTAAGDFRRISGAGNITGGFGGGQLGYNFQTGPFVFGIETDIQGSDIRGNGAQSQFVFLPGSVIGRFGTASVDVDFFGTVRGRIGYSVGGVLLYATGGFAYGGTHETFTFADTSAPIGFTGRASNSQTQTGWVAGAGIEYKITPSWSLKGEYQFIDLGSASQTALLTSPMAAAPLYDQRGDTQIRFSTVRAGVNYYFNTPYEPLPLK
jgi:outer membrane immunogenic protein